MARQRDVHRAIAAWYALRQIPVQERLLELLADYSPAPGETTIDVIARMAPGDQAEALDLAAVLTRFGDASRHAIAGRRALASGRD